MVSMALLHKIRGCDWASKIATVYVYGSTSVIQRKEEGVLEKKQKVFFKLSTDNTIQLQCSHTFSPRLF